jgi:hypothetical protein
MMSSAPCCAQRIGRVVLRDFNNCIDIAQERRIGRRQIRWLAAASGIPVIPINNDPSSDSHAGPLELDRGYVLSD